MSLLVIETTILTSLASLPVFQELTCQQLVIFLKDTSAADLTAIVEFMYKGSVSVAEGQLASFLMTAEMLQVQGLSGCEDKVSLKYDSVETRDRRGRGSETFLWRGIKYKFILKHIPCSSFAML